MKGVPAARHSASIRQCGQRRDAVQVLDLREDPDVGGIGFGQGGTDGVKIRPAPDKGLHDGGHAVFFCVGDIFQVRRGEGRTLDMEAGGRDTLAAGELPSAEN